MNRILFLLLAVSAVFPLQAQLIDIEDYDPADIDSYVSSSSAQGAYGSRQGLIPEASAIARYSPVPVSLFTGTPSISIPIYTIESGDYQLPVQIGYQATGIKVAQEASRVGLGWNLHAGGVISRVIQGKDDLKYAREKRVMELSDGSEEYDADEPDIFYYSFGSYSGRFYLRNFPHEPTQYENLHGIVDPYGNEYGFFSSNSEDNLQISYDSVSSTFTVTSQDRTKYIFSEQEQSQRRIAVGPANGNVSQINGAEVTGDPITMVSQRTVDFIPEFADSMRIISAWHLKRIELVNGDTIECIYDILSCPYVSPVRRSLGKLLSLTKRSDIQYGTNQTPATETQTMECTERQPVLREIRWKNGKVLFQSGSGARQDMRKLNASASDSYPLANIKVVSNKGDTVRSFRLHHSYFTGKPAFTQNGSQDVPYLCRRLRLDSISVCGGSQKRMSHAFGYNMTDNLPAKNATYTDRYGYNAGTNLDIVPFEIADLRKVAYNWEVEEVQTNALNRLHPYPQPSNKASVWTLTSHRQPTGAVTTYEYECHEVLPSSKRYVSDTLTYTLEKSILIASRDTLIVLPKTCRGVIQVSTSYLSLPEPTLNPNSGLLLHEGDSISMEEHYRNMESGHQLYQVYYHTGANASSLNIQSGFPLGTEYFQEDNRARFRYSITKRLMPADTLRLCLSSANAIMSMTVRIFNITDEPVKVGGIRIKCIHEPTGTTSYTYRDGMLLRDPVSAVRIKNIPNVLEIVELHSDPLQPIASPFTGQYIGYGTVETERVSGNNHFRHMYTFNTEKESMPYMYSKGNINPLNGKCLADSSFVDNTLISAGTYEYNSRQMDVITSISKENDRNSMYKVVSYFTPTTKTMKAVFDSNGVVLHRETNERNYESGTVFPCILKHTADSADSVMKKIVYTTTIFFAPDWERTDGRILPVEETLYMRGEPYKRIVRRYSADSLALPLEEYVFYKTPDSPWPQTLGYLPLTELPREEWTYTPDVRYTSYDSKGRLTSFETRMGQSTVQLWGYNHQYLIAEVKNARLQDVTSCGVDIEAMAGKAEPSSADWTLLKSLRTLLPQSLVTIYQYKPLVGVTSIFAPSGMETSYTYDEFNRLQTESIVEGSANVIHKYEYKYATENQ